MKVINVIDVECTCWPTKTHSQRNEIIEIGITQIDVKEKKIIGSEAIFVTPPTMEISKFCTDLTSITADMVAELGIPFPEAMKILDKRYKSRDNIYASWGKFDDTSIRDNCYWNAVKCPLSNKHINVKAVFEAVHGFSGEQNNCGEYVGAEIKGTRHRGVDDSIQIANILLKLIGK